jgi:hypothetical protein
MDKLTYSSDTTSAVPGANLSVARYSLAATGNSTAGYFGGGAPGPLSTMDKVTYATDTTAFTPGANLSSTRYRLAASSPRANALSSILSSPLPYRFSDGSGPTPNTGYFGGGTPGSFSTMDKVTYSSDTTAAVPGANLSAARYALASTASSTAGYFGGGSPGPGAFSTIDKVTYSSDTTAAVPGASLSAARYGLAATGNSTAGYFGGGIPNTSTMDKVTYSSDTTAAVPGANLSVARSRLAATGSSTAGYFGGGFPGPGAFSTIDKVTYSSDTTAAVPGANLSIARYGLAATGNSTAGYFGGGFNSSFVTQSAMNKLTYSTDTTAAAPSGANLSAARAYLAATGSSTAGYFGGGPIVSRIDKLTYSTDTTVFTPGANLSAARYHLAASSARANALPTLDPPAETPTPTTTTITVSDAGYFGGGLPSPVSSRMDKLTYSTDTTVFTPSANLSAARYALASTASSTAGYFGGGSPGSGPVSTMDKVTYASDTTAAVPGAVLSTSRKTLAATGSSTLGYFGGGFGPGLPSDRSTMDKVIYSSDTTSTVPGANLSAARFALAATGNSTAGYFGGGNSPAAPSVTSLMDKLTYSTDTTAAVPGANLSIARRNIAATGSSTAGYFGGGANFLIPASYSTMDKLTYSSDTTSAVPGANLSVARYSLAATGNSTAGYFGGGFPGPFSRMDKLTYASDTTAFTPGANLSASRNYLAASSARANALPSSIFVPNIV